ncbi:MAG: hemerythrin domain-containing protein [Nitrososphaerales archaeon]
MSDFIEVQPQEREMIHLSYSAQLKNIISTLRNDHNEIKRQLWILRMLDSRRDWVDYATARNRAAELEALIDRHIHDEESKLLYTFAEATGREKVSAETIAAVFEQHKLILAAFKDLHTHSIQESNWSSIEELERIVSAHIKEEDDRIFPLFA